MRKNLPDRTRNKPGRPIIAVITLVFVLGFISSKAQNFTVTGQVTAGGLGLPGVSILERGTSQGTTSDSDGRFTMNISSPDAVLVFSFIGYRTQEISVANRSQLDVDMEEEVTALNEVVVTALGVKREVKSLGYAVQSVEGKAEYQTRIDSYEKTVLSMLKLTQSVDS